MINQEFVDMNEVKNKAECPICYEICENPKALPCNHVFCLICVQRLEKEQIDGKIKCPLCRIEHNVTTVEGRKSTPKIQIESRSRNFIPTNIGVTSASTLSRVHTQHAFNIRLVKHIKLLLFEISF